MQVNDPGRNRTYPQRPFTRADLRCRLWALRGLWEKPL
nr:MAG TPA: hypothetical protein [Caudoviricetes sp.]